MRVWICVVLMSVATVRAQQDDYMFPDYWQNDYDNFYDNNYKDSDDSINNLDVEQMQTIKPTESDKTYSHSEIDAQNEAEGKELDALADYQIEDNRSNSAEKEQVEENKEVVGAEPVPNDAKESENNDELAVIPLKLSRKNDLSEQNNEENKDEVDPLLRPTVDDNKDILEDTKDILSEDNQGFDQQAEESVVKGKPDDVVDSSEITRIIEETNKLLRESSDSFGAEDYDGQEREKSDEELFSDNNDEFEENTPEKVYTDLNADLDKLFETIDKLRNDNSEEEDKAVDEAADGDSSYVQNVQDYEEKYGRPYNEDVALSWRESEARALEPNDSNQFDNAVYDNDDIIADDGVEDDYENLDDSNLSDIFETRIAEIQNQMNENNEKDEPKSVQVDENINNAVEESLSNDKNETINAPVEQDNANETFDYVDNFAESLDNEPNADDDIDSVIRQVFSEDINEPQSYGNDALIDENQPKNEDAAEFESIETDNIKIDKNIEKKKSKMVDDLTRAEFSELMSQFVFAHSEDLDVHSKNFARHVAPIHVTLSVDEPTVITSPNYPAAYPTNNIVDWIFEGPGTGIELNVTDFAINGALGDFVLVKPGGIDDSGNDGLVFSFRLNAERRYRFTDVNRMFVRFQANPGMQYMTGFSFSVKMIWPLSELVEEQDQPESEAVVQPPQETLTLNLAGLSMAQFTEIHEDFIELIADMANAYIKDNNIDRGLNTTLEVTQITRTAVCNIRWPDYETCVEVTFGVPLQYEDAEEPRLNAEDLDAMWTGYIIKEHYAERLRSLGITEYAIPNDRTVLMVWLVIAAGVLISMAMLAFALWRFSCFEDYTRMKAYSDTDSLKNEKRHLDLYPTPHQTLPPLYSENAYKWADDKYDDSTRVDIGGFSNKSYVRDELFDLDSDEDVITTRDRKGVISPRDIYDV